MGRGGAMGDIVRGGSATAEPRFAYSAHLEIAGLSPGRPYWYRFASGDAMSRVGRAVTAPAAGSRLDRLRFAFVSCSNYQYGYFSPYPHLPHQPPEIRLFLGDFLYQFTTPRPPTPPPHTP